MNIFISINRLNYCFNSAHNSNIYYFFPLQMFFLIRSARDIKANTRENGGMSETLTSGLLIESPLINKDVFLHFKTSPLKSY